MNTKNLTTEIWDDFSSKLFGFIKSKVSVIEDAEDILQEVFVKIQLGIDSFKTNSNLNAWLYTITRNAINDFYRKKGKLSIANDYEIEPVSEETKKQDDFCCLDPHIQELSTKYKEVIVLSEIQGIKHQEIANQLNISLSAVKSRVVRGRELLKTKFVDCCNYHLNKQGKLVGHVSCENEKCNH
jgi:RNA polymerase sigma-70 factor (ECF subfamily)